MAGEPLLSMEFGQMAGEDDEVIVSLPPGEGETGIVKVGEGKVKTAADDEAVADLRGQFDVMKQRATTAERTAQTATQRFTETAQRLQQVEGQVVESQLDTVTSGLAAAEAEASSAERELAAAFDAGDGAALARAQRKIASSEARIQRLQEAKADLEDATKRRPDPATRQPTRAPPSDPVERFAEGMSARSAAWIRAHPDCITDPKKNARMLAAHNLALAEDIAVDSDEYFQRIEDGIKPKAAASETKPSGDGRRPSSAAAPASGAGGNLNGGTTVSLTKGEAASATDGTIVWNYPDPTGQNRWQKGDPIGLAEMARRKHEGKKAGLYDRNFTDQ